MQDEQNGVLSKILLNSEDKYDSSYCKQNNKKQFRSKFKIQFSK